MREVVGAVWGDENHVLDAYTEVAGQVQSGFAGDDHAGFERVLASRGNRGRFVDFQADSMSQGVGEPINKVAQNRASNVVGFGGLGAWFHGTDGGFLGFENPVVYFFLFGSGGLGEDHARHVRSIAFIKNAHVNKNEVAFFEFARGVLVVGHGGVIAKRDDGLKGNIVCAEFGAKLFDQVRDFEFGYSWFKGFFYRIKNLFIDRLGPGEFSYFGSVFQRTLIENITGAVHPFEARSYFFKLFEAIHGKVFALEFQAFYAMLFEEFLKNCFEVSAHVHDVKGFEARAPAF